jgi:hypothetical protein
MDGVFFLIYIQLTNSICKFFVASLKIRDYRFILIIMSVHNILILVFTNIDYLDLFLICEQYLHNQFVIFINIFSRIKNLLKFLDNISLTLIARRIQWSSSLHKMLCYICAGQKLDYFEIFKTFTNIWINIIL